MKDKEVSRMVQANLQLQEEIASLKSMMTDYSLCKKELEGYKMEVLEKVCLTCVVDHTLTLSPCLLVGQARADAEVGGSEQSHGPAGMCVCVCVCVCVLSVVCVVYHF